MLFGTGPTTPSWSHGLLRVNTGERSSATDADANVVPSDIRRRSVRGGVVTLVSQGLRFVFRMVSTVVLARLLSPADFGLIAMVLSITSIANMFKDAGLTDATLQKDTITDQQVSTLFWISSGFGLFVALGVAALGPVIAWFYNDSRLVLVTAAIATIFVFGGISSQHQALLRRNLLFGRLGVVDVLAAILSAGVAILAAAAGAGYWSLVMMHVSVALVTAIGCWFAMPWRPGRPRRASGIRAMIGFGANVTGFNLVNYFSRNADNVLIGRVLGAGPLGIYSKAYSLLMLPVSQIRAPIVGVGLPALSRLQNDPSRYRSYYEKLLHALVFMTSPVALILAAFSHELVLLFLGEQWLGAADVFRILSVAALLQAPSGTVGMVMLSSGNASRFFRLGVFTAIVVVGSFVVGLPWGILGVAVGFSVANVILLVPSLLYAFKGTPVDAGLFLKALVVPYAAATGMAALSRGAYELLRMYVPMAPALAGALVIAAGVYLGLYMILPGGKAILNDLKASLQLLVTKDKPAERPANMKGEQE